MVTINKKSERIDGGTKGSALVGLLLATALPRLLKHVCCRVEIGNIKPLPLHVLQTLLVQKSISAKPRLKRLHPRNTFVLRLNSIRFRSSISTIQGLN